MQDGATDFEFLPIDVSLARCLRYYQEVSAGTVGVCWSTTSVDFGASFPVRMRAIPTIALTSALVTDALGLGSKSQSSSNVNLIGNGNSPEAWNAYCSNFSGLTVGVPVNLLTTGGKITFSIEL